ncbi:unnamed protein product [Rotaria socialis]|uniref:Uncharacterized protein n=1 Tax=Rotaria socialis TaxID=392032 RepID=A0A818ZDC0_9BILA|nr:unnamed protein product [Rotaria socialis]
MAQISIMAIRQNVTELIAVRNGNRRIWKIVGCMSADLSLVVIAIIIMASRGFRFSKSNNTSTSYTTVRNISNREPSLKIQWILIFLCYTLDLIVTSTALIDEDKTSPEDKTSSEDEISTTPTEDSFSLEFISPTTTSRKDPVIFTPDRVSDFFGWEGDDPLYLFAISAYFLQHKIIHRYPVMPETNNTEWQTIEISFRSFPVFKYNLLAIGMQTSSRTNQIYGVRSAVSIHGKDITDSTTQFFPTNTENFYGIVFTYTAIEDGNRIFYKI